MAKLSTQPAARKTGPSPSRSARKAPAGKRGSQRASNVAFGFPWTRMNVIGICAGVVVIIVGYMIMGSAVVDVKDVARNNGIWNGPGPVTIAPIILTIGYCVIVPFFIFKRFKRDGDPSPVTAE